MSVASKSEGVWTEKFAGRVASEGVVGRELAEDGLNGAPVRVESAMESSGGMEHERGAPSDAGLFVGGEFAEGGVLDKERAAECGERGVG